WVAGLLRRRAGGWKGAGAWVPALLVAAALAWTGVVSSGLWMRAKTWTDPDKLKDAAVAEAYLEAAHVPSDRPVVFIMAVGDWNGAGLNVHMMRAALPATRIQQLYVYDGSADSFVKGQPLPNPISRGYFRRVQPVLTR